MTRFGELRRMSWLAQAIVVGVVVECALLVSLLDPMLALLPIGFTVVWFLLPVRA